MTNKTVKFSERMYGKDGERKIVEDGARLANLLLNPPVYDGAQEDAEVVRAMMKVSFRGSDVHDEVTRLMDAPTLVPHGIDEGYTGLSFSAVLWACATFLMGNDIEVNGEVVSLVV